MNARRLHFPWLSTLLALLLLGWQFLLLNPALVEAMQLTPTILEYANFLPVAMALLLVALAIDVRLFVYAKRRYRDQLERYQRQVDELFEAKRSLGTRARTYSDHADKLKMFISDRLLEYIEYDEKFLHFKNIASEVRHNGVISYDMAQTALKQAQQQVDPEQQAIYVEAADALLYLWDLLDLSTTDNIALHVANRIYDCEEHYFQAQLNPDEVGASPLQPTFNMSQALRQALHPITDFEGLDAASTWPKPGRYEDGQFKILLGPDCEMLGNVNHMVLLIENLVNNALYYAQQRASRNQHNRVGIELARHNGEVWLKVYNRGPHIDDDEKDKIYQLGFSSRRVREHHGKGLGLYFVSQITHGFEGGIAFENVTICPQQYRFSVKLTNGKLLQQAVAVVDIDGKPMCELAEAPGQVSKRQEWHYDAPIASVEVSSSESPRPQLIAGLGSDENRIDADGSNPLRPYWLLETKNKKRSSRLVFTPQDIRGVEFLLRIPTASSRLENQE